MELRSKQEMKLIVMFLFFAFVAFYAASCKIGFRVQVYQFLPIGDSDNDDIIREKLSKNYVKRFIVLVNDSVLRYNKRNGGIGSSVEIKYKLVDNELFIDSLDIYNRRNSEVLNECFLYSKYRLINKRTNEVYYKQ